MQLRMVQLYYILITHSKRTLHVRGYTWIKTHGPSFLNLITSLNRRNEMTNVFGWEL